MPQKNYGLIAAVFTPFDEQGQLALDGIKGYASFLTENGLQGVFVGGTTGEGLSLRLEERKQLAEAWVRAADKSLWVIVHVGHNCLGEAQELAAHAQAIGAGAVSAMAPCFLQSPSMEDLVAWCQAIAEAAPLLPFYYYHIPSLTGVSMAMPEFLCRAVEAIPNFAGIKYTHEDLAEYRLCLAFESELDIFFGRDELLLSSLEAGGQAAVGSTYNFAAPLYQSLIRAYQKGDLAQAEIFQQQACRLIDLCRQTRGHLLAAFKALMEWIGMPCGPVRPPLRNLTPQERMSLCQTLAKESSSSWWCRTKKKTFVPS